MQDIWGDLLNKVAAVGYPETRNAAITTKVISILMFSDKFFVFNYEERLMVRDYNGLLLQEWNMQKTTCSQAWIKNTTTHGF